MWLHHDFSAPSTPVSCNKQHPERLLSSLRFWPTWIKPQMVNSWTKRSIQDIKNRITSWWFQPIWKILFKLDHFRQVGVKIKNVWNHHLDYYGNPQSSFLGVISSIYWGFKTFIFHGVGVQGFGVTLESQGVITFFQGAHSPENLRRQFFHGFIMISWATFAAQGAEDESIHPVLKTLAVSWWFRNPISNHRLDV